MFANLAEKPEHGLAVEGVLETHYQDEINHGQLCPDLGALITIGGYQQTSIRIDWKHPPHSSVSVSRHWGVHVTIRVSPLQRADDSVYRPRPG